MIRTVTRVAVAGLAVAALSACTPNVESEATRAPSAPAGCQSAHIDPHLLGTDMEYRARYASLTSQGWRGSIAGEADRIYSPECFLTAEDGSSVLYAFYA